MEQFGDDAAAALHQIRVHDEVVVGAERGPEFVASDVGRVALQAARALALIAAPGVPPHVSFRAAFLLRKRIGFSNAHSTSNRLMKTADKMSSAKPVSKRVKVTVRISFVRGASEARALAHSEKGKSACASEIGDGASSEESEETQAMSIAHDSNQINFQ